MKNRWWILALFLLGIFVRIYRLGDLLAFHYDQGRDAKVIWDLWHHGKLFLIGPTTGIEGIFRGPWYYWLIAPWYLLGSGNPVWPAVFLGFLAVVALVWIYQLASKLGGPRAGLIALVTSALSLNLTNTSRWLSNPTPMLLISMGLVQSLVWAMEDKKYGWLGLGTTLGLGMQFGSAAEIFYVPVILILVWIKRRHLPWAWMIAGGLTMGITLLPQIIFDLRHQGILRSAVYTFLVAENSFKISFWQTVKLRLPFYAQMYFSKIYPIKGIWWWISGSAMILSAVMFWKKLNQSIKILLLLTISPLIGMLFFQGNYGNVYDYYFTGYYLVFVLIFAIFLSRLTYKTGGKILVGLMLVAFLYQNIPFLISHLNSGIDGPATIVLGNQKQAIEWIYADSENHQFNVDVYVPPVIPHSYDYLFLWLGDTKYKHQPEVERVSLLYTLYEVDPPHPERLIAWLNRQKGIGEIEKEATFGGIIVQRRLRL